MYKRTCIVYVCSCIYATRIYGHNYDDCNTSGVMVLKSTRT